MYLITDKNGAILALAARVQYAKVQENGYAVRCAPEDATAVYADETDQFYPVCALGTGGARCAVTEVADIPAAVRVGRWCYRDGAYTRAAADAAELTQQDITELQLADIAQGQSLTDLELMLLEGKNHV